MHGENAPQSQEVNPTVPAEEKDEKASYETPVLIVHGEVEKLTLAS
jgi:hypothetical protein